MTQPERTSGLKVVETRINKVTVYTNQALVTRRGMVELTGEERELVVSQIPTSLQPDSVRIRGVGTVEVRLLGVSTERIYSTEPVRERVAQITGQIEQLEAQKRHLQAQVDSLGLQSNFLQGLQDKAGETFAHSLARKNISLSETLDLVNFLGSQYTEYAIAVDDYKSQQRELDQQLQALRASLKQIQISKPQESFSLVVGIESGGAGEFRLEVSYVVNSACWTPLYDLRVDSSRNTINLGYLAEINQNSGEDWMDVELTLSTAKPGLGTLPPKLQPWYIDVGRSPQPKMMTRSLSAAPAGKAAFDQQAEELEEGFLAAETMGAEMSKAGSVVTFKLNGGGNIPSDGAPHKTTILQDDFPCNLEYVAMPSLVSFAYLQARVSNSPTGGTLLPGKANIFRDDMFVGTTQLENIAPGQEFTLNLGIEEGLQIERELVERQVDKKLIGSNRKITYAYRILVTNLLEQAANLQLTEQLPVSRNEQIKVRLNRSNPPIQTGEMGMLEWQIAIAPQEQKEVYYQFIVEHPSQLKVVGLDI